MIECDHYDGGQCRMRFYGGHPTAEDCQNRCGARTSRPGHVVWRLVDGTPQPARGRSRGLVEAGLHTLVSGAAGLAKSAVGIDRAAEAVIESRRAICNACPRARVALGVFQQCGLCGCLTEAKTTLANEKCPAGKW
jgi:hypothetical protein